MISSGKVAGCSTFDVYLLLKLINSHLATQINILLELYTKFQCHQDNKGNRIESLDFDVLVDGSKFYEGLRIHESVKELHPIIYILILPEKLWDL